MSTIEILDKSGQIIQIVTFNTVIGSVQGTSTIQLFSAGEQGPPGVPGSAAFSGITGEAVSAYRAVVSLGGLVYLADPTNLAHAEQVIGIVLTSVAIGLPVEIQQSGKFDVGASIFPANSRLFVGLNGTITGLQIAPGAVWAQNIGISEGTDKMVVGLRSAVLL